MTETELRQIEERLGFPLPEYYRARMLTYPFPDDEFARQYFLFEKASRVLEYNTDLRKIPGISQMFVVGHLDETRYYVDASHPNSPVYEFDLETGKHSIKAKTWEEYLEYIRTVIEQNTEEPDAPESTHRTPVATPTGPMWHGSPRRDVIILTAVIVASAVIMVVLVWLSNH